MTTNQLPELTESATEQNINIICVQQHKYYQSDLKLKYHEFDNKLKFVSASAWKHSLNAAIEGIGMFLSLHVLKSLNPINQPLCSGRIWHKVIRLSTKSENNEFSKEKSWIYRSVFQEKSLYAEMLNCPSKKGRENYGLTSTQITHMLFDCIFMNQNWINSNLNCEAHSLF